MTRAALTKLLILVILTFIICLPEFFTLYRVSKVKLVCLPYGPCERESRARTGERGEYADAEVRRRSVCGPSWEPACVEKESNMTDPVSDSSRGGEDPEMGWFMCETNGDVAELHNSSSKADTVDLEMSVELQMAEAELQQLTLYGRSNHSSLHLHPPEKEEEERAGSEESRGVAFYCCLSASDTANGEVCLLRLSNQTVSTAVAKETLPWKRTQKDEWSCVFRVLWLALLCLMLLTIITTVLGQINWRACCFRKPKVHLLSHNCSTQQSNDGEKYREVISPRSQLWSAELETIPEVDTTDNVETLLDGNVDHCYIAANLHHRSHPLPPPEEQAW